MEAIGFDLGETLIYYNNVPQSWKGLYRRALSKIVHELGIVSNGELLNKAEDVLSRYNTRIHPREHEVTDIEIFNDILNVWELDNQYVTRAISVFFDFFQQESKVYEETKEILKALKVRNIRIGILTDVPYGMNKTLVLRDIEPIKDYVDVVITSVDVGYRKPRPEGFIKLAKELKTETTKMIYVGNELKDIELMRLL
ncbi:putative hydrolase of the HAD superfamily [Paenibacillus sophorae]|uniref:HAD family hydrolase n=1 Tax=Paenibacillus sophorae TaxID=1333845 RepID=A0A1H8IS41_9BACL|nr:HAD family hydrolase [Paenibacillus sophorae]QWU16048.1 HAD family hydrolase [Paenibacillus sophorae]SEN70925.1 putative hydrolase of the HAD superfamily [Paenibacillus sophorae]